jgi:hypothetical protein
MVFKNVVHLLPKLLVEKVAASHFMSPLRNRQFIRVSRLKTLSRGYTTVIEL